MNMQYWYLRKKLKQTTQIFVLPMRLLVFVFIVRYTGTKLVACVYWHTWNISFLLLGHICFYFYFFFLLAYRQNNRTLERNLFIACTYYRPPLITAKTMTVISKNTYSLVYLMRVLEVFRSRLFSKMQPNRDL